MSHADLIYFMRDGQIEECGTYWELMGKNGSFAEMINVSATDEMRISSDSEFTGLWQSNSIFHDTLIILFDW